MSVMHPTEIDRRYRAFLQIRGCQHGTMTWEELGLFVFPAIAVAEFFGGPPEIL
jgi:hypothetical protein